MGTEPPIKFGRRILHDVALGLSIIGLSGLMFLLRLYTRRDIKVSWFGLIATTGIVFWYSAQSYRKYWRYVRFWTTLCGLLLVHIAVFTMLLLKFPQWPLLWFLPVGILELIPMAFVLEKLVEEPRSHRHS